MWLLCGSYVTLMFLLTKLDEALILNGIITDFAPTLHRLWYGGETKEERTTIEETPYLIYYNTKSTKKQRCANKFKSHSGSCVKMRRNDIIKRKRGGDGGDDSI